MKFYAIKTPQEALILNSWDECLAYIKGKKGVKYKSFKTEEEALAFLNDEDNLPRFDIPTAYIDGSYDASTGNYSFGGVLIIGNNIYRFNRKFLKDEYSQARNVAGEIKGAGFIIQYCVNREIKELAIYYDYEGIEKWYNGAWKAESLIAKSYVEYVKDIKDKIRIHFVKVKSHSNNYYNDQADLLAKEALGLK